MSFRMAREGCLEQLIQKNLLSWNTVFSLYQEILKKKIAK